ncbi:E3 ubiquitin-protein ligase TRIM39-like [Melanotaenia boesemani]|uniref:E3 ubiquitin-protein ligase TRIM39-like n=1 Tax=Melanotaenia boesemani TaxID=1250792 RepID=UPI001C04B487|nr:E3 ubiquitin-protein ligase TRIM39-like [Melanotaenia boesemani]
MILFIGQESEIYRLQKSGYCIMSALSTFTSSPVDQFQCSICLNISKDPVSTPCGHNICRTCLNLHYNNSELYHCKVCNKRFHLRPALFKKTIISEISVQIKKTKIEMTEAHLDPHQSIPTLVRHKLINPSENLQERVCEKHARILEFFCRHEQVCICLLCCKTEHKDHHTVPIEEEGDQQKQTIASRQEEITRKVKERIKKIEDFADSSKKSKVKIKKEIEDSEKLFNTLIEKVIEIQEKLKSSMEEKLRKSQERDQAIIQSLREEIKDLQWKHSELEQLLQNEDPLQILQTLQALNQDTKDWSQIKVSSDLCMESVRSSMSNVVHSFQRELKTVTKKELKIMRHYKESVTFDPSTAGPYLMVTESGTCLKHTRTPSSSALSDNSQRFKSHMVFGKDGFISGRHYWEVRVGRRNDWDVGVAKKTVDKTEEVIVKKENGFFSIGKMGFDCRVNCSPCKVLHLSSRPRHVGVYLDYEEGRVSFYDVDEKLHIYTFRVERFTGKLFPYFYMYSSVKKPGTLVITTT